MNAQTVQDGLGNLWTGLARRAHLPERWSELHLPQRAFGPFGRLRVPGFRLAETLTGTAALNGEKSDVTLDLSAEAPDLRAYLRTGRAHLAGHLTIAGMANKTPFQGELWLHPLQRRIDYELSFRASDGRLLRFNGDKKLELLSPLRSLKHLPGHLRDDHGREVAKVKMNFRSHDLPLFLRSLRPLF
jgi:hypothetical protein